MVPKDEIAGKYKRFGCKVLLVGEYLVLNRWSSLAMPYDTFGGGLELNGGDQAEFSWNHLVDFLIEKDIPLNFTELKKDLSSGLVFRANIPMGYGLGSSGALIASLYDAYHTTSIQNLNDLKLILARMESFFHGQSSGIDPLVILANQGVLLTPERAISVNIHQESLKNWYLLDSGISRSSTAFIKHYREELYPHHTSEITKLADHNGALIELLTQGEIKENLQSEIWKSISEIQLTLFSKMIPQHIQEVWQRGLETDAYYMKLCGAGGGGFFLLYNNQNELPENIHLLKL